jgi:hypothetical protein
MPAIGIGLPADWPRAVSVMSSRRAALLGVIKEQLVEIPHAEKQQLVGVLRLGAEPLLHDGGVRRQFGGRHGGRHRARVRQAISRSGAAR